MMRSTPLYAPDGLVSAGTYADHFDDGLVHNHHWAVTADEAYPSFSRGLAGESIHRNASVETAVSSFQSHSRATYAYDHHDDGLVHNHEWAVSGK